MKNPMDSSQARFILGNFFTAISRANSEATMFAATMVDVKREVDLLANYCAQLETQLAESERRRESHKKAAISFKRQLEQLKALRRTECGIN